jgi:hypothetical protein
MGQWVQEWRALHSDVPPISNFTTVDPKSLPQPVPLTPMNYPENIINAPPAPVPESVLIVDGSLTMVASPSVATPNSIPNAWAKPFG